MYHYKSFSMIDLHSVVLTDNNSRTYTRTYQQKARTFFFYIIEGSRPHTYLFI